MIYQTRSMVDRKMREGESPQVCMRICFGTPAKISWFILSVMSTAETTGVEVAFLFMKAISTTFDGPSSADTIRTALYVTPARGFQTKVHRANLTGSIMSAYSRIELADSASPGYFHWLLGVVPTTAYSLLGWRMKLSSDCIPIPTVRPRQKRQHLSYSVYEFATALKYLMEAQKGLYLCSDTS